MCIRDRPGAAPTDAAPAGQLLDTFPDADPAYVDSLLHSLGGHVEHAGESMLEGYPRRESGPVVPKGGVPEKGGTAVGGAPDTKLRDALAPGGPMRGFFQQLTSRWARPSSLADGTSSIQRGGATAGGSAGGAIAGVGGTGDAAPEAIQRHVQSAIRASRPDASSVIQSRAQPTEVREASSNYCDVAGINTDLRLAGSVSGMKVYVSPELDAQATLTNNGAALQRLIDHVYRPVGRVFGVDPQSLSVFCDVSGPSIAFNRGGSIFLNLRYYLAWHDADVAHGRLAAPLVSVYFTLAHELAHNLVAGHNAEHEFYFSSIAEQYFLGLASFIARTDST